jgi:hypothetical protein
VVSTKDVDFISLVRQRENIPALVYSTKLLLADVETCPPKEQPDTLRLAIPMHKNKVATKS